MSVDTRTPRPPTGARTSGADETALLSMVEVPSDPAQITPHHAVFRVRFGSGRPAGAPRDRWHASAASRTAPPRSGVVVAPRVWQLPAGGVGHSAGGDGHRRAPVVWSGRSAPGDPGATRLLQAVRHTGRAPSDDVGRARELPRGVGEAEVTLTLPTVGAPRGPVDGGPRPGAPRPTAPGPDAADHETDPGPAGPDAEGSRGATGDAAGGREEWTGRRRTADSVRHAYYPGRRMDLGLVLLPLRIVLGLMSVYAGMSRLCDPGYFDGSARGSLVRALRGLHPWAVAEPLRDTALAHPVGAGLTFAFLQVIAGVLTVLGLWQRLAAAIGALLTALLVLTVSRQHGPGALASDVIYLAAWSPLVIAGAPVYSVDGRLTSEAWRTLGPRAGLGELRRRVLRRGILVAGFTAGATLLFGALLGGAVRDAERVRLPGPGEPPHNALPGSPLPEAPRAHRSDSGAPSAASGAPDRDAAGPSDATTGGTEQGTAGADARQPDRSQNGGPGRARLPAQPPPPATGAGPSVSGGSGATTTTTPHTGGGADTSRDADSGSLVGGLLG